MEKLDWDSLRGTEQEVDFWEMLGLGGNFLSFPAVNPLI